MLSAPLFFFFNDTATTEIYTLSLHDALPISHTSRSGCPPSAHARPRSAPADSRRAAADRKSTRLNSSHTVISYAVFCLKKKKKKIKQQKHSKDDTNKTQKQNSRQATKPTDGT